MVEIEVFVREKKKGSFHGILRGITDPIDGTLVNTDIIAKKWLSVDAEGVIVEIWVDDILIKTIDLDEYQEYLELKKRYGQR